MKRNFMLRMCAWMALLLSLCLLLSACGAKTSAARLVLDGEAWKGGSLSPDAPDALRVFITLDGAPLADLPFGEAHTVSVLQSDGSENTIALTGDRVYIESANCENQDCVEMGAITRDNLEVRVMGGFIICLPHRLSVEVREG